MTHASLIGNEINSEGLENIENDKIWVSVNELGININVETYYWTISYISDPFG